MLTIDKPTITNRNIKSIKGTNIAYVKPHIININNKVYIMKILKRANSTRLKMKLEATLLKCRLKNG